ncbi:Maltose O-acetyltransferase [Balamuthia mandrillaris]
MENQQQQPQTTTSSEANVDATSKELENMLSGELYNASDPLLVQMRNNARKLLRAYNQSTEEEKEKRTRIISELFLKAGEGTYMEPPFYCDYGRHISVGRNFYMNFNCVILDCAHVDIGDNVLCGPNVQIYAATHPLEASVRILGPELARPIKIGNNVWLGGGAILCPGVTIGDNTTIGAGSVVTKDIPANVLAAGNPCKVIKHLPEPPAEMAEERGEDGKENNNNS